VLCGGGARVGGITYKGGAVTQERAQRADMFRGAEAGAQEADGVQVLQSLRVAHVDLLAGNIFRVARVDEADFDPGGFENLEER